RKPTSFPPWATRSTTCVGGTWDSGNSARNLEEALKGSDWQGFSNRRAAAQRAGKLRGIGVATYIEACGGAPDETAEIPFMPQGEVHVLIGNQSNGQGHETAYAQLIHERLGGPFDKIKIVQGDTGKIAYGTGTGGNPPPSAGG